MLGIGTDALSANPPLLSGVIASWIGGRDGDEENAEALRYYAGIVWDKPIAMPGDAERLEIAGGLYVCHRLIGHHDGIPGVFEKLYGEWFPASGYVPDDRPSLELYRNNPFDTPANALITDILIPVRRE